MVPDVGRDNGDGEARRERSSIKGVFCSRFMVGGLIVDDDDEDIDATIGRGTFVVELGRKRLFDAEFISNGNANGDGIGGRNRDRSLFPSSNGNGGGKNVD